MSCLAQFGRVKTRPTEIVLASRNTIPLGHEAGKLGGLVQVRVTAWIRLTRPCLAAP